MEKAKEEQERAIRAALAEKERKRVSKNIVHGVSSYSNDDVNTYTQYYMAVVDKAEEDKKTFHDKCLQLMRVHVEQQRQRVQEASERLRRRMKKRQRREKVSSHCPIVKKSLHCACSCYLVHKCL